MKFTYSLYTRDNQKKQPDLILLIPTSSSSTLQEELANFVNFAVQGSDYDRLLTSHSRIDEFQAADCTLEQIARFYILIQRFKKMVSKLFVFLCWFKLILMGVGCLLLSFYFFPPFLC